MGKTIPSYVNRTANIGKGILGVMSLPSQAVGGIVTGLKRAVSRKESRSTLHHSDAHASSPTGAEVGRGAQASASASRASGGGATGGMGAVSNLPVASPAGGGGAVGSSLSSSTLAPMRHFALQGSAKAAQAPRATPPRLAAHADDDILFC